MFSTTSTCLSRSSNVHMFCSYSLSMRVGTQLMDSWLPYNSIVLLKLCVVSDNDVTVNHLSNDE